MKNVTSARGGQADRRGRLNQAIREALRDLGAELSLLSQRISGHLDTKAIDLQCLDLIDRHGPLSPGTPARMADLHPVTLQPVPGRRADVLRLASGMNAEVAKVQTKVDDYTG